MCSAKVLQVHHLKDQQEEKYRFWLNPFGSSNKVTKENLWKTLW